MVFELQTCLSRLVCVKKNQTVYMWVLPSLESFVAMHCSHHMEGVLLFLIKEWLVGQLTIIIDTEVYLCLCNTA